MAGRKAGAPRKVPARIDIDLDEFDNEKFAEGVLAAASRTTPLGRRPGRKPSAVRQIIFRHLDVIERLKTQQFTDAQVLAFLTETDPRITITLSTFREYLKEAKATRAAKLAEAKNAEAARKAQQEAAARAAAAQPRQAVPQRPTLPPRVAQPAAPATHVSPAHANPNRAREQG